MAVCSGWQGDDCGYYSFVGYGRYPLNNLATELFLYFSHDSNQQIHPQKKALLFNKTLLFVLCMHQYYKPRSPRMYGTPNAAGAPSRFRIAAREPSTSAKIVKIYGVIFKKKLKLEFM